MTASIKVRLRQKDGGESDIHRIGLTEHYENWWEEYGSPDLRKVYENFGMEVFRRSSCLDGFNAFVDRAGFKGKRCIEIGTCHGLTAIVLARYFDEVITFDITPKPIRHEIAAFCGVTNIRFVDVTSNAEREERLRGVEFDAAYIDGNHTRETHEDFALVGHCGQVMFHEYWPLQPAVWQLVNDLRERGAVVSHGTYAIWRS